MTPRSTDHEIQLSVRPVVLHTRQMGSLNKVRSSSKLIDAIAMEIPENSV